MNSVSLMTENSDETPYWMCGKCKAVKLSRAKAESCCMPPVCKCGKPVGADVMCEECWSKQRKEDEAARFQKASKVSKWGGFVFVEGMGYNAGFFESVEDLVDWCQDEHKPVPEYAWTCREKHFVTVHLNGILEEIEAEGHDGFSADALAGLDELKTAIAAFEEANKDVVSYEPDLTVAVLVGKDAVSHLPKPPPRTPGLDPRQETINRLLAER